MDHEGVALLEGTTAESAPYRTIIGVQRFVILEASILNERCVALATFVRLVPVVCSEVGGKTCGVAEAPVAAMTFEGHLSAVNSLVNVKRYFLRESCAALDALERPFSRVKLLVVNQSRSILK